MEQLNAAGGFLAERWAVQAAVEPAIVLALAAGVVVLTAIPRCWRILRQASTMVHEMGHVLAAWGTGRRVSGIRLHSDTSGLTVSTGRPRGPGMLVTALAGYPAPGILAVGMAALSQAGYAGISLTLYNLVVLLALLLSRNAVGVLSCLLSLGVTGGIWWVNDARLVAYTVVALTVFYGLAGVRGTLDVVAVHLRAVGRGGTGRWGDAGRVQARQTDAWKAREALEPVRVPAAVWLAFFLVVSAASAVAVVWLMV